MYKQSSIYKSTASTNFNSQKIAFGIIALTSVIIAMIYGLLAVTANPIIISLAIALLAGIFLLAKPLWIIWLVFSLGLLVIGILPLHLDFLATKAAWGVSLLGFFLLLIASFRVATSPSALKNTPVFVWVALIFLAYTLINSLIQFHTIAELLGGFKRYFQMWGLLFAICWLAIDQRLIDRWKVFFLIVVILQLPFSIYEWLVFVPQLEGTFGKVGALDVVSGTFGASAVAGGSSGEMATFLMIVLAFLLARRKEKILSMSHLMLFFPFLFLPLLLGETKVIVLLLPLMFFVLYRQEMITRFHYWFMGFIVITFITISAGYYYLNLSDKPIAKQLEDTIDYNLKDRAYAANSSLNRTTVLKFWVEQQGMHDPVSFFFGNGLGSSNQSSRGHIDRRYPSYGIGLTAASTLLWDTGVIGFALFLSILALAWRTANQLQLQSNISEVRADAMAIQAAIALFAFHLVYRVSILELPSFQIIFVATLGYLAWLHRRHNAIAQ